jgi:S-adenosylmethionine decarboxylase proenzyme
VDTFARHLLVELHGCNRALLNDRESVAGLLRRAALAAGARPVAEVFHPYAPQGVTGVLIIEESHFSVHTWPEYGYAALDFYTCGDCEPERAANEMAAALGADRVELVLVHRGVRDSTSSIHVADVER